MSDKPEAVTTQLWAEDLPKADRPHSLSFDPSPLDRLYDWWEVIKSIKWRIKGDGKRIHIIIRYRP